MSTQMKRLILKLVNMKRIANQIMLAFIVFVLMGMTSIGAMFYQEGQVGGAVLSVVSMLTLFLLIFNVKE